MRKPSNPFLLSGYHSPQYFCNREDELNWLMDQYRNERNAVIHSWRRIGKTALLRHFFYHLEKSTNTDCVFVDLLGTTDLLSANRKIGDAIVRKYGDTDTIGKKILKLISSIGATLGVDQYTGTPQLTFALSPPQFNAAHSLGLIGGFLTERGAKTVVCLDEFQQITNYPEGNSEAVFRAWMQEFPMIRFVFSGSHRQMMASMFSEKARPFYRSSQILPLNVLEETKYRKFIATHFSKGGKKITDDQTDKIFAWTRMQTYYVQLACNKLFGKEGPIGNEIIHDTFEEIIQQEAPVLSSYQSLFTSYQWKVLVAIAKAGVVENPLGRDFLGQYALGAASSVKTAIDSLKSKEFIIYNNDGLTVQDTLLMRWLQQL